MTELFQQHRLNLRCRGALQPVGIEVDPFLPGWIGAGVGGVDAAEAGSIENLETDPQTAAAEAHLQMAARFAALRPEHVLQQGVVGVGVVGPGRYAGLQQQ